MIKKLFNIDGAKVLSSVAQKNIKGGKPVLFICADGGACPSGFCCSFGICVENVPVNGTYPACE